MNNTSPDRDNNIDSNENKTQEPRNKHGLRMRLKTAEYSDEECDDSLCTNSAVIPYELNCVKEYPVFGNVNVENSTKVHLGNKTIFNGPVVIKQIISSKDNHEYMKSTEEYIAKPSLNSVPVKDVTKSAENDKKWRINREYLLIIIFSVVIIASLIALISIIVGKNDNDASLDHPVNLPSNPDGNIEVAPNSTLRYVTRQQWIAQPPTGELDPLSLPTPFVIITHTATENCTKQSSCVLLVRTMQTYHIESRNWNDIGYNFLIGGDGSAYVGRGWNHVGAHTLHYNKKSIGIAFIGTFNTIQPTTKQVNGCRKLIEEGIALGKISRDYKLYGHRQLISTLSPGDTVYEIIKKWPHWTDLVPDLGL